MLRTSLAFALMLFAACGTRPSHRFSSPMLGTAQVPLAPLPSAKREAPSIQNRADAMGRSGVRADGIRVSTAPPVREASAQAAAEVVTSPAATRRDELPAPHRSDAPPPAPPRQAAELRALVGRRDKREPIEAALAWARDLGAVVEDDLLAWAERTDRLHDAATPPERGDLLVFDRVNSDHEGDLIGVVIARDERNVTEFLYLGGGVIRRGFVDAARPTTKRDRTGAIVNTFLRTGKRWPAKGSRYLAGEHLAHVIR